MEPRYLGVRHCSLSDSSEWWSWGDAQSRSDFRLGTSSQTPSHLLPSPATCWTTRFPKS